MSVNCRSGMDTVDPSNGSPRLSAEALRESELQAVLDAVPALVWITHDPDALVMGGNRLASEFLSMPPDGNPSKTGAAPPAHFDVWRDGKPVPPRDLPLQRAARGEVIRDYQEQIVFEDGRRHTIYGNAIPLLDASGQPRGSVGAFIDVTSLAQMLAAQRAAEQTALQLAASRAELLRGVAHDFNQPLTAIAAAVDRFAKLAESDRDRKHIKRAQASLARLRDAMQVLLQMASVDSIECADLKPTAIQTILDHVAEQCVDAAADKGLRFTVMPCAATVTTDTRLLTTILQNFIGNAIKYTPKGRVLVGCRPRKDGLRIDVLDTGLGIPKHRVADIFNAFSRAHRNHAEGLGLGLSIVERCAKLLGQTVSVRSVEGKGSAFSITVPMSKRA